MDLPKRPTFERPPEIATQVEPRWLELLALFDSAFGRPSSPNGASSSSNVIPNSLGRFARWSGPSRESDQTLYSRSKLEDPRIQSIDLVGRTETLGSRHTPLINSSRYLQWSSPKRVPFYYERTWHHGCLDTGFEAIVYEKKSSDEIVICFRGTDITSLQEWMHNLALLAPSTELPARFQQSVDLARAVQTNNPDRAITLTGTSLGGAQASYAAFALGLRAVVFNAVPMPEAKLSRTVGAGPATKAPGNTVSGPPLVVNDIININLIGDPVSNPEGKAGNFYPFTLPGSSAAQIGRRIFFQDGGDPTPEIDNLSVNEKASSRMIAPRNRQAREDIQIGMHIVNRIKRQFGPMHSPARLMKVLAAGLERQGIDPQTIAPFVPDKDGLRVALLETPPMNQNPLRKLIRRVEKVAEQAARSSIRRR
jgi:Uncharacterised protein family (UPF0227)